MRLSKVNRLTIIMAVLSTCATFYGFVDNMDKLTPMLLALVYVMGIFHTLLLISVLVSWYLTKLEEEDDSV